MRFNSITSIKPRIDTITITPGNSIKITVPVEYMLAGLAALGIARRTAIKKKIIEKQKVGVGA